MYIPASGDLLNLFNPFKSVDGFLQLLPQENVHLKEIERSKTSTPTPMKVLGVDGGPTRFHNEMGNNIPPVGIATFSKISYFGAGTLLASDRKIIVSPLLHNTKSHLSRGENKSLVSQVINRPRKMVFKVDLPFREISSPCVPLHRLGEQVYGHWLVDILPRVALTLSLGLEHPFIVSSKAPSFALDLLSLLGVSKDRIVFFDPRREGLLLHEAICPLYARQGWSFSSPLRTLSDLFNPYKSTASATRRIYVSRGNFKDKPYLLNYTEVESKFKEKGFEVVAPHLMSIREQIKLFSEANIIAGEYGSAMHNTLFCPPGTHVIVLQGNQTKPFVQMGMGEALDHPTSYIFGQSHGTDREFSIQLENIDKISALIN